MGEERLKAQMEQADPTAAEQLQQLLAGQRMGGAGAGSGSTGSGSGGGMLRPGSSSA